MLTNVTGSLYALQVPIPYPMGFVTVLIDVARPVTLIDAALDTPEARQAIEDALAQLGLHWERIERVIVTHHHPDHYGLSGLIEERSGATVYMLDVDITRGERYWHTWEQWLPGHRKHFADHGMPADLLEEMEAESRRTRERVHPVARIQPLNEGQRVRLADAEWEVLWLPGHADGHLGLWQEQERLLIAGDAILPRISPNVGLYAYSRPDPLGDYLGTLRRLHALAPNRTVVGHYGPFLEDAASRAVELLDHHAERLDVCRAHLSGRAATAFELSFTMFPRELSTSARRFALAETLAHVEFLRLRGELLRDWNGSAWVYRSVPS